MDRTTADTPIKILETVPKEYNYRMFCLFICFCKSYWSIIGSFGDVTIAGKRLQNVGLCSARTAVEQGGGIFIVPRLL